MVKKERGKAILIRLSVTDNSFTESCQNHNFINQLCVHNIILEDAIIVK